MRDKLKTGERERRRASAAVPYIPVLMLCALPIADRPLRLSLRGFLLLNCNKHGSQSVEKRSRDCQYLDRRIGMVDEFADYGRRND